MDELAGPVIEVNGVPGSEESEPQTHAGDDAASRTPSFSTPVLVGRNIYLRPLGPEDYSTVRALELSADLGVRWRARGAVTSPEQWSQTVWQSTLAQFVVASKRERKPLGLVLAYRPNFQDGHAWVAAEKFEDGRRSPLLIFGFALFLDYVFRCWNFRKVYLEVAEFNTGQFDSAIGRVFTEEGRMREHFWYDGRRWDQYILALYREQWDALGRTLVAAETPAPKRFVHLRMPR